MLKINHHKSRNNIFLSRFQDLSQTLLTMILPSFLKWKSKFNFSLMLLINKEFISQMKLMFTKDSSKMYKECRWKSRIKWDNHRHLTILMSLEKTISINNQLKTKRISCYKNLSRFQFLLASTKPTIFPNTLLWRISLNNKMRGNWILLPKITRIGFY